MAQRLKRWESPRNPGRNDKGRGGSAKQRQRKKQFKALKKRLQQPQKTDQKAQDQPHNNHTHQEGREKVLSFF
ncbi:MAG: hypothetical protein F6K09_35315 [Merismopedia sp. SIO2A8]|nr:hypothetical protein [Merismopedia sp. SIO2A8]